jgi:DHA1 family tetracycline resistance protein-like MFS transporter
LSSDSTAARRAGRAAPFEIKPLLFANMAGATVTVSGALWMTMARVWGTASDRRGRRPVLLLGVAGVCVSYAAMCLAIDASLRVLPSVALAFMAIVLSRGAVGLFYGSIPAIGQALIADHVPPHRRAGALASFGAAGAMGLVLGPAAAAWLAQFSLSAPLYGMAGLPFVAWLVLWRALPKEAARAASGMPSIRLADARLRRPMTVAFVAMFGVGIAQITVGFYALDRLGLEAAAAARVAGVALTLVGVALVLSQIVVRRLALTPQRMIRIGGVVAASGFAAVAWVDTVWGLWACHFVFAAGMGWIFPAFAALASNAVEAHEQGATAGSIGAAQGMGMVTGPLIGTLLYAAGPAVPYLLVAAMLLVMALWPATSDRQSPD